MGMRYDAFISYRHGDLDGLVAERLHKLLETYRIPGAIAKKLGKKKLERIFRDREELPTSSNLSDSINDALENSEFLLLICSRRTCQSQWVMREVERFGEMRGKDRIITLLIDGEPDDSFPPGLREREVNGETIFVEPLAADIRAETWKQSLKILNEEKLRLLSPILGVPFDALRRRHRRRKIQQIATVVSSAFVFSLSFGGFSTWQYLQIDKQMQLKLENQSRVLAEYSREALDDGDPETAMLLALQALPQNLEKPERPLVSSAERALSDALMVYNASDSFAPHKSVSLPAAPGKALLSPNEQYAALLCPYNLVIVSTESGGIIATLPSVRSALADVEFLSDDVLVYTAENGVVAYDIAAGTELWQSGKMATALAVSADKSKIAAVYWDSESAFIFDNAGAELAEISFGGRRMRVPVEDSLVNPNDSVFELNDVGNTLAVSFSDGSLALLDTSTGAAEELYPVSNAIHFDGGFYKNYFAFAVVETGPYASKYRVYNMQDKSSRETTSPNMQFIPLVAEDGLYFASNDQILTFNPENGELAHVASAGGAVAALRRSGGNMLVSEKGGSYSFIDASPRTYQSDYICNFIDLGASYALTASYDSKSVRILRSTEFPGEKLFDYDKSYYFYEARINRALGRVVFYSHEGMRLCDLSGNIVAEAKFADPLLVKDTQYNTESGNVVVIYSDMLRVYSGRDGSLLVDASGKKGVRSVFFSGLGASVLAEDTNATLYNLATGEVIAAGSTHPKAERALSLNGGVISVRGGNVYLGDELLGSGDIIGASKSASGEIYFAISDGSDGKVFMLGNNRASEIFAFEVTGRAEAYFCGEYAFISSLQGDANAYSLENGVKVRELSEKGYLAETLQLGDYIVANYATIGKLERYSFLLDKQGLEPVAYLPGFLGEIDDGRLVLNSGESLLAVDLLDTTELIAMADEKLGGKQLSEEEKQKYKAG